MVEEKECSPITLNTIASYFNDEFSTFKEYTGKECVHGKGCFKSDDFNREIDPSAIGAHDLDSRLITIAVCFDGFCKTLFLLDDKTISVDATAKMILRVQQRLKNLDGVKS